MGLAAGSFLRGHSDVRVAVGARERGVGGWRLATSCWRLTVGSCRVRACDCAQHGGLCGAEGTCVDCAEDSDCPEDRYCHNELCAPDTCTPESAYCEGVHWIVCSSNGSGLEATFCPEGTRCEDGDCISAENN